MKRLVIAIIVFLFSFSNMFSQIGDSIQRFDFQISLGGSFLSELDQSYISSSSLTSLDHRLVGNIGLGVRWNILKKTKVKPHIFLGINSFRSKASGIDTTLLTKTVEFKNTFISYTVSALASTSFNVKNKSVYLYGGVFWSQEVYLIPYSKDYLGNELKGFKSLDDWINSQRPGGPYYRGPMSIGTVLGAEYPVNKIKLGLFYNQRFWFTGFNREIARVMLRVGF